jgi:alkylated DNA repair dioxygenase AlkB
MTADNLKILEIPAFFTLAETETMRTHLSEMPLYRPWNRRACENNDSSAYEQDDCLTTVYGGIPWVQPYEPMPPWLAELRQRIERHLGLFYGCFNTAVVRCFRTPSHCNAWHSDAHDSVSSSTDMVTLSLGAARPFELRDADYMWPKSKAEELEN